MVRQNLPFVNPCKDRNGYTNLLPAPRHIIAFHTPGAGVQEDLLLNPSTDWGQAGWPAVLWISLPEDGLDICLFPPSPVTTTFALPPHHLHLWHDTHTPHSSYNHSDPLTSIHISKLLLIILLPLALYHNLPFQNSTLTYTAFFEAYGIWLRFFKDT